VVGLICGDIQMGLILGGTLELVYMGAQEIGGSVPANTAIGTALGTYFAIVGGMEPALAITLIAIPAATIGAFFEVFAKAFSTFFISAAEKMAEKSNIKGIALLTHLGNLLHGFSYFVPVFIAAQFGQAAVEAMVAAIPAWLNSGLNLAGNILPALGFGLLLSSLAINKLIPFFFIGFVITVYAGTGVLGTAVLAALIATVMMVNRPKTDDLDDLDSVPASERKSVFEPGDSRRLFWRSFGIQSAFSFDRMQAMGFTWALLPILKREYANNEAGLSAAIKRHLAFFNTFPWLVGTPMAIAAEMEIKIARGEKVDSQSVQGIKSSLMGPLAGIGDSMFHGTLRPIMGGLCASLALGGNSAAPWIFFLTVNAIHVIARWWTLKKGIEMGERLFTVFSKSSFRNFMEGAMITGLMAAGALVATWLNFGTPLTYVSSEGVTVSIQAMLNGIFPKILPLSLTMLVFFFVRKGIKTTYIMLGLLVFGFILGSLRILG
jgi:PTS system mannose-specific IID component